MNWITSALKLFPLILAAVRSVERMGGKKGKEKQDAAVDLVGDLIPVLETGLDRDVVNDGLVQSAMRKVIDAVVELQNAIRDTVARRAAAAGR